VDHRGTHLVVDLYGCRAWPPAGEVLRRAAAEAGLTVVASGSHRFGGGGGETAFLVLSQSHTSVHTWPEGAYAAFDLYSCRPMAPGTAERVTEAVARAFMAERREAKEMERGGNPA
jgi:S-adenosylmethionine decarboxylase